MKNIILFIVLTCVAVASGCAEDESQSKRPATKSVYTSDPMRDVAALVATIEYALYTDDRSAALHYSSVLSDRMMASDFVLCTVDQTMHSGLMDRDEHFMDQLRTADLAIMLEYLRSIKRILIENTCEEHVDPFVYRLWRFEEAMYHATQTARDPLLDLYEWNEFSSLVDCMNDDWQWLQHHAPTAEYFGNNYKQYQQQTKAKIGLKYAIDKFNEAVQTNDYEEYPLCDHAERLRRQYVYYLRSLMEVEHYLSYHYAAS